MEYISETIATADLGLSSVSARSGLRHQTDVAEEPGRDPVSSTPKPSMANR